MKMINLLILLFVFSNVNLMAATWVDEIPIYFYGDVTFLKEIFVFVSGVVTNPAMETLVVIGITFTTIIAGIALSREDLAGALKIIHAPLLIIVLFILPTSKVHLVDLRVDKGFVSAVTTTSGGYEVVEGVPFAIAFIPAGAMLIINQLIELVDEEWNVISTPNKFSHTGFMSINIALSKVMAVKSLISSNDPDAAKYQHEINTYINKCILNKAISSNDNAFFIDNNNLHFPAMFHPSRYPTSFSDEEVSYRKFDGTYQQNKTCSFAFNELIASNALKVQNILKEVIEKQNSRLLLDGTEQSKAYRQISGDTISAIGSLSDAGTTSLMNRFVEKQKGLNAVGIDGNSVATEITIRQTMVNLRTEGPAKFKWLAESLPDTLMIIIGIMIACFPFFVIVQTFVGGNAYSAILNYFMGFSAMYFNFFSLALVQAITSYFSEMQAQETLVGASNLMFSIEYADDFLFQQADTAGIAGLVATVSVFAVTPLIFYGESKGFSAALTSVNGAFRGNVAQTASDTAKNSQIEAEIDKQLASERGGMNEADAAKWLGDNGFAEFKDQNRSSLETYNQILRGTAMAGAGMSAEGIIHNDNMQDYLTGSHLNSNQQNMKTVGMGGSIDSIQSAGEVALQDGQVMASTINATSNARSHGYDTESIGEGAALQQYAKDMNMAGYSSAMKDIDALKKNSIEDGLISGSTISNIRDNRDNTNITDKDGNSVGWNVYDIARGQALQLTNKDFAAMGTSNAISDKEENSFLQGGFTTARKDANSTIGIGDTEVTKEDMKNIQTNAKADLKTSFANGKSLSDNFGNDLNDIGDFDTKHDGKKEINFNDMIKNEADSKIASRMGAAKAFEKTGFDMVAQNSLYGAASKELTTDKKISEQGGVDKAIKTDVVESAIKAKTQAETLDKNLKVGGNEKGLSDDIKNLSSAINNLASTSSDSAAAKTNADMSAISQAGGGEKFIEREGKLSRLKSESSNAEVHANEEAGILDENGNVSKLGEKAFAVKPGQDANSKLGSLELAKNAATTTIEGMNQAALANVMADRSGDSDDVKVKRAGAKAREQFKEYMNEDGTFKTGQDYLNAKAKASQGMLHGNNAMVLSGGGVLAGAVDVGSGKISGALTTGLSSMNNSSTGLKSGDDIQYNPLANLVGADMYENIKTGMEVLGIAGGAVTIAAYGKKTMEAGSKAKEKATKSKKVTDNAGVSRFVPESKLEEMKANGESFQKNGKWTVKDTFSKYDKDAESSKENKSASKNTENPKSEPEKPSHKPTPSVSSEYAKLEKTAENNWLSNERNKIMGNSEKDIAAKQRYTDAINSDKPMSSYSDIEKSKFGYNDKVSSNIQKNIDSGFASKGGGFKSGGGYKTKLALGAAGLFGATWASANETVAPYFEAASNVLSGAGALVMPTQLGAGSDIPGSYKGNYNAGTQSNYMNGFSQALNTYQNNNSESIDRNSTNTTSHLSDLNDNFEELKEVISRENMSKDERL